MPETTPQDRKQKAATGHKFTVDGKSYTLPFPTESAVESVPGEITHASVMDPNDDAAQLRLAFATLEASKPSDAARKALLSLSTGQMLSVLGDWMGESSGSSDS